MSDDLDDLHPCQREVYDHPARFKVLVAGRRFGKTWLAVHTAVQYAAMDCWPDGTPLWNKDVYLVGPTHAMAREIFDPLIGRMAGDLVVNQNKVSGFWELSNGCKIWTKSAERYEALRGRALRLVVCDEISLWRPGIWETVLRPMLVDVRGRALFIGTPNGRGTLYDLFRSARADTSGEWAAWQFKSTQNPFLDPDEVAKSAQTMGRAAFAQEYEASFDSGGGSIFKAAQLKAGPPMRGVAMMAVKFGSSASLSTDFMAEFGGDSAIIVVIVSPNGWHIARAQHGPWTVDETINRVYELQREHRCAYVAISGADFSIARPAAAERSRAEGVYPRFWEVRDSDPVDRTRWALQGRLQQGRITCTKGKPLVSLRAQLHDYPLANSPNELVETLALIAQLPQPDFSPAVRRNWQAGDLVAGY